MMASSEISPFPELLTDRLILRRLVNEDLPGIFTLRSDESVNRYLDRDKAKNSDDARNFIDTINKNIDLSKCYYWAICFKDDPLLLGTICLFSFSDENREAEIGFELLPAFGGKGIMHEAIGEIIRFSFEELRLARILAFVHPENLRSIRLLLKKQFTPQLNFSGQNDSLVRQYSLSSHSAVANKG